jgi:hypothetical protein
MRELGVLLAARLYRHTPFFRQMYVKLAVIAARVCANSDVAGLQLYPFDL